VFLVVCRRLADFEGRSTLKTWIVGITLRVGMDHLRRQRRRAFVPVDDQEWPDDSMPSPLELTARSEAVRLLYTMLDELDPDKRMVFVLAEIEGMPISEIATALGANVNTVGSRLKAARRRIQAAFDRHRSRDGRRHSPA
jgi:RNA polymerase sigma-70 factor, ECF subfamily